MPMMQIAKKAPVSQDFIELFREMSLTRYKTILSKRKATNPQQLPFWDRDNMPNLGRIKALFEDKEVWDRELTKLKTLPFVAYGTYTDGDKNFLCVETDDILLEDPDNRCKWNMGHYLCYVNSSVAENGLADNWSRTSSIHFVPKNAPWTFARHPHHKATTYDEAGRRMSLTHPTQMFANTCWGTFGSVATLSTNLGDFTELLRILNIYLTRYNPRSALGFPNRTPFDAPERHEYNNINACVWKIKTNITYTEDTGVRDARRSRRR
jgi:hypothetical protein